MIHTRRYSRELRADSAMNDGQAATDHAACDGRSLTDDAPSHREPAINITTNRARHCRMRSLDCTTDRRAWSRDGTADGGPWSRDGAACD